MYIENIIIVNGSINRNCAAPRYIVFVTYSNFHPNVSNLREGGCCPPPPNIRINMTAHIKILYGKKKKEEAIPTTVPSIAFYPLSSV